MGTWPYLDYNLIQILPHDLCRSVLLAVSAPCIHTAPEKEGLHPQLIGLAKRRSMSLHPSMSVGFLFQPGSSLMLTTHLQSSLTSLQSSLSSRSLLRWKAIFRDRESSSSGAMSGKSRHCRSKTFSWLCVTSKGKKKKTLKLTSKEGRRGAMVAGVSLIHFYQTIMSNNPCSLRAGTHFF